MKSKKLLIAAATLAMIGAASVGPAMAYFTDSAYASGKVFVAIGDTTLIPHEDVKDYKKTVVVENTGNYDVFVRVRVFSGSTVKVEATSTEGWTKNGDYYEYNEVVEAHRQTDPIVFTVTPPADKTQEQFNVIVVEEATRAVYGADGSATKDWNNAYKTQEDVTPTVDENKEGENNEN